MASAPRSTVDRLQLWAEASGTTPAELTVLLRTGVNLGFLPKDLPVLQDHGFRDPAPLPGQRTSAPRAKKSSTKAAPKNGLVVGHSPGGKSHRYLPLDKLSSQDFEDAVIDLWEDAGYFAEDVRFTDHRGGPRGLEAGGKHFAPGVLRLDPEAPGFYEVRTQSGSPAWVANAFFSDSGRVIIKVGHEYERFWNDNPSLQS